MDEAMAAIKAAAETTCDLGEGRQPAPSAKTNEQDYVLLQSAP
jgi:hypothetical protein